MSNAHDSVLAFCLASYSPSGDAAPKIETSVKVVNSTPKSPKAHKVSDGAIVAPANNKPPVVSMKLPSSGTLNARQFLKAMNASSERDDLIVAIAAYIGYDDRPFGVQESNARAAAKREINPPKAEAFQRSVIPSIAGYVKGMPDHSERHYQDLLARERCAVNMMLDHEKEAMTAPSLAERQLFAGLADLERERLIEIRKDLAVY